MLGERPFDHLVESEQAPHPLVVHDEGADVFGGRGGRIVRHVEADPFAAVPFDDRFRRVPRLARRIGAGAIIEDAPVGRPRPSPVRRDARLARIARVAPRHLVALLGVAPREDPAARHGRPVIAQLRETVELLPGFDERLAVGVLEVDKRAAIHFLGHVLRIGVDRIDVIPRQIEERIGEGAAVLAVHFAQAMEEPGHDPDVASAPRPAAARPSSAIAASAPN